MRGYTDSAASEVRVGDIVIEPTTGVLCAVESIEPVNEQGLITLHMRGSSSLSYMGIVCKPERVLRRGPRDAEVTVSQAPVVPVEIRATVTYSGPTEPNRWSECCACGMKSRAACVTMCLKG